MSGPLTALASPVISGNQKCRLVSVLGNGLYGPDGTRVARPFLCLAVALEPAFTVSASNLLAVESS